MALDKLRCRSFDSLPDRLGMVLALPWRCLDHVGCNAESESSSLQIILVDQRSNLALDLLYRWHELVRVTSRASFHAFESIQVQLSLSLLQQFKERLEEASQVGKWDDWRVSARPLIELRLVQRDHGETLERRVASQLVIESLSKNLHHLLHLGR